MTCMTFRLSAGALSSAVVAAIMASITGAGSSPFKAERVEADGLHNVFKLTERLYSGSSPDGDAGFASLVKLGVKTIISVDGARPDVQRAKKHGLRYVHLPIGYDAVPQEQAARIAKAVRDLPGPVYLHCHHGKHRGPAAAAVVLLCLDPDCPVQAAVDFMKQAGTDPHYEGLYLSPAKLRRPTKGELDKLHGEFPETAQVAALARIMVEIDARWDHLKQVKKAGWKTPADAPDLDPPHEALQLKEHYREAVRLLDRKHPEEVRRWLGAAEGEAAALETTLRPGKDQQVDAALADKHFQAVAKSCLQCHAKYRDVQQPR